MTRRRALQTLGLAGSSLALGCVTAPPLHMLPPYRGPKLAPVRVERDRIIRRVVGLRPFRPSGFMVRADKLGEKTVIHNYGHGGGGVTLSWGTSQLAVDLARETNAKRVAVLGCGAVGLATARLLQERGVEVAIYARDVPPDTTSNVAGAWWNPFDVCDDDKATPAFLDQFHRAVRIAYRRFQTMVGPRYGIDWIPVYALREKPIHPQSMLGDDSPIRDCLPGLRELPLDERPFHFPSVRLLSAMMIEPPIYLSALRQEFLIAGGKIEVREFHSAQEIAALPEKVAINCTGLGSKQLFDDPELTPIKGQLTILLPQPEVRYAALPPGLYMLPRSDGILLGGTFVRGDWTLEFDSAAEERILAGHTKAFASIVQPA
jgi:glycine/D-amino acid oxidase-like deaminating enzyme